MSPKQNLGFAVMQAFLKMQSICQPASNFIPNLPSHPGNLAQSEEVQMPSLAMPLLPLPNQDIDGLLKSDRAVPASFEASVLLCQTGAFMNREARVLR